MPLFDVTLIYPSHGGRAGFYDAEGVTGSSGTAAIAHVTARTTAFVRENWGLAVACERILPSDPRFADRPYGEPNLARSGPEVARYTRTQFDLLSTRRIEDLTVDERADLMEALDKATNASRLLSEAFLQFPKGTHRIEAAKWLSGGTSEFAADGFAHDAGDDEVVSIAPPRR